MKKYRLLEDFAGLKKDTIIVLDKISKTLYYTDWKYKGSSVIVTEETEFLEECKIPLVYTNEDEVYYNASKSPLYYKDEYYLVNSKNKLIGPFLVDKYTSYLFGDNKRFLTKKAAQDYILLQNSIIESGLKIGDRIGRNTYEFTGLHYNMVWRSGIWVGTSVLRFIIVNNKPCLETSNAHSREFYIPLNQFKHGKSSI